MDGRIREHLAGVAFKHLKPVECPGTGRSNQHELGASTSIRTLLGTEDKSFGCTCLYLDDDFSQTGSFEISTAKFTYYDARRQSSRSPEYRLYFPNAATAMLLAEPADYCWLLKPKRQPDHLTLVVAARESAIARQLDRLFGTTMRNAVDTTDKMLPSNPERVEDDDLDLEDAALLDLLGIPITRTHDHELAQVIDHFGQATRMPTTRDFCDFVRKLCPDTDDTTDIDTALAAWYSFTAEMFRGLEEHIIGTDFNRHFANKERIDLDTFFEVSRRYQNSRFKRAGDSWESHLDAALHRTGVHYCWNKRKLADGVKPDFLFPSREIYTTDSTPPGTVTFMGAKTTAKERWLQLVGEAAGASERYLATMDRELNREVLITMKGKRVIPVIPESWIKKYYTDEPEGIISFADFIVILKDRENALTKAGFALPTKTAGYKAPRQ